MSACTPCGSAISIPTPPVPGPTPETSLEALSALKTQLKQQLALIEAQEKAAEESLKPQSVEEVDALEKQLTDALEELKLRRTELQNKQAGKK
ncbi:MAG: hypothetical protein JO108_01200 [Acidobacteriaceae bacterium]|nr:hypothetical protein [Acidobacteriaceae bacterium]